MSDNIAAPETIRDREMFQRHLEKASQIVRTWPLWMQCVLGSAELAPVSGYEPPCADMPRGQERQ